MKKFAFAVVFAVAAIALPLSSSCSGGPKCKKTACAPACSGMQYCDLTDTTCKDFKTCSPACTAPMYCDPIGGSCVSPCSPACKTDGSEVCEAGACKAVTTFCSPACGAGKYCEANTCKDIPVCNPVCDATKGEYCTN